MNETHTLEKPVQVPVPRALYRDFQKRLMGPLCMLVRDANAGGDPVAELLSVGFANLLVSGAMRAFYLDVLDRRTAGSEQVVHGKFADGVRAGRITVESPYLGHLRKGPSKRRNIPALARYVHSRWIAKKPVAEKPLALLNRNRDIVAISAGPVIARHARASSEPVWYVHPGQWIHPVPPSLFEHHARELEGNDLIREAVDIVRQAARSFDEPIRVHVMEHFVQQVIEGAALIACHMERLNSPGAGLPKHLWTGTGNLVWNRLIGAAVRQSGGHVTVHDHGPGAGLRASHMKPILDFYIADTFVTTTKGQAEALQRQPCAEYRLKAQVPVIKVLPPVPDPGGTAHSGRRKLHAAGARRKVMVIGQPFYGDDIRFFHPLPDPLAESWARQLVSRIRSWGYTVVYKPHPEVPGPTGIFEDDVEVLDGLVENHVDDVDLVVFDWTLTSALKSLVLSKTPGVFIDLGHIEYDPVSWKLMKKRFAVVEAAYDGCSEPAPDWVSLRNALDAASGNMTDTGLGEYLYS